MLESLLQPHTLPQTGVPRRINALSPIEAGETKVLADIEGQGCIRHFFVSMPPRDLRCLVIRMYWDGEEDPSVECPVSDFFGIGHDETTADLRSPLFYVAPKYGYNCYIPMPFSSRARIELANEGETTCPAVYMQLGMRLSVTSFDESMNVPWRFHAVWRRVLPAYRRGAPLTLLEAKGDGRLIGLIYHICKRDSDDRWSHGGGDHIYLDGDTPNPAYVYGIGGEDFAHHAWGLYPAAGPYSGCHYCHPVPGVKRSEGEQAFEPHGWEQHDCGRYSMYRFFIPDPIAFRSSARFGFGTCANEISATTYWYQDEPHSRFCSLPPVPKRAFASRLTEEETLQPLDVGPDLPVAVLGPMMFEGEKPWSPEQSVDFDAVYDTDVRRPYGDVVRPPYRIRWRRSTIRGGFIDLAAIHRPKCAIRARGLWNQRHLPLGIVSYQLLRVQSPEPRELLLRLGFEDRVFVWLNRGRIASLSRPEPKGWDTEDVNLPLPEGVSDLVIGYTQDRMVRWSAWGLYLKFLERDGSIADGLEFEPFEDLDPTPERWREPWPPEEPIDTDDYRDPLYFV